ncbi:hypothetical protein GUY44_20905 [Pimelobacter simplex]|uniref:Uncharacterized protein n=1 Tax=Nocardioides simplex TaxID=2045 RepID=A0A0A1DGD0_NOCSI|nr:hypothetical protein [Pimelobacter simplex]AIY16381.1 hypothetical protein KR76_05720 [Pimelobacter simplex]MCG8152955.1 hypothetical protein [Pimelobacter simplex]GEB11923.1 hypothetical protein NSI01_02380 [Pimelobacter simplex]SFN03412.1 hypothetical protein SAMN05421671_4783 [Pimelobacter simplex]
MIAVASVIVIVASFLFLRPGPSDRAIDSTPRADDSSSPTDAATPTKRPKGSTVDPTATGGADGAGLFGGHTSGLGVPPGLQGSGDYSQLPKHRLTIRMSTAGQLGQVAWIIPTSVENHEGTAIVRGGTWTLSTTVYGNPDYAVVFAQQGRVDQPVTCTITVDGRVSERRSTKGAYSAMWCEG